MTRRFAWLVVAMVVAGGCGGGQDGGGARDAGQQVGETLTNFASGVGKGIDKGMEVSVELSEQAAGLGLRKTAAKATGPDREGRKGITVYLIASKPVKTTLLTKALTPDGDEIGRSAVEIDLAADDAQYVAFAFDAKMDTQLVAKYVVEVKPASTEPAAPPEKTAPAPEKTPATPDAAKPASDQ